MRAMPRRQLRRTGAALLVLAAAGWFADGSAVSVVPAQATSVGSFGGNGVTLGNCLGSGWTTLQTSSGMSFTNPLSCLFYALLGGQLKRDQTVKFTTTAPTQATIGSTYRPAATASSGLPVSFSLDSAGHGCTIAAGLVSFTAAGTCVVDANQAGNSTYGAATTVKQSMSVVKASQMITFTSTPLSPSYSGSTYRPAASASSTLTVALSLDAASTGCSLASGLVTFAGTGTCVIDADQAGNTAYLAAPRVQQMIQVVKTAQSASFTSTPIGQSVIGGTYTPTASSTSGLSVAMTLDATSTGCSISALGVITFTSTGTCLIDADQAGNINFLPATRVTQSVQVFKKSQTVSFSSSAPAPGTVNGTYTPTASATSILPVAITLDGHSTGCTLSNAGVVTFTTSGTCLIDADQVGDDTYGAAAQVQQSIQVVLLTQSVSFASTAPTPGVANATYSPSTTATSGLPVMVTLDATSSGCTISAGVVTFSGTGTCVIDADQPGNTQYSAASRVQQSIQVIQQTQTIALTSATPSVATVGGSYVPTASATSGLAVTFSLGATSSGCTISAGVVTFSGTGTCVIDADQPGNLAYQAASTVPQTFAIIAANTGPTLQDDTFTVNKNLDTTAVTGTTLDVLANDTAGSDPMTITAVTQPVNGTVTIGADGQSINYLPSLDYCNHSLDHNEADTAADAFTYTVNGVATANVAVTVDAVDQAPINRQIHRIHGPQNILITNYTNLTANTITNSASSGPTMLDASDSTDPATCGASTTPPTYHWVIMYLSPNQLLANPYTDFGISGYHSSILTIASNSMIVSQSPNSGTHFQLTTTSAISGLSTVIDIQAYVVTTTLTIQMFQACQQGMSSCTVTAARPAPAGTT
jgi:hypothetical protein